MNLGTILEMISSTGDRAVVTAQGRSLTASQLSERAYSCANRFRDYPAVLYLGANHLAYPVALFGAALAGIPFVPLNYRLGQAQLDGLLERHPGALVLRPDDLDQLLEPGNEPEPNSAEPPQDPDAVAVTMYTSGTTSEPKAAVLRHRHLFAYLLNAVEFGSAAPDEATLVAAPPYHIAGLTNLLSNLYAGRRIVYLPAFDAGEWLETVRREQVTHAMVVPTMLARIVGTVDGDTATPTLRNLSYGGAHMPQPVLERALEVFPNTAFVNAYGLTETASTVAILGPEDHRAAQTTQDPAVRRRLSSVGRPLPGVEVQLRSQEGTPVATGESGLVFVRGEQISGEYGGRSSLDAEGWFATGDLAHFDDEGYLFLEGRADDTIIRGGENIAPAEIEDVLLAYPGVVEAAVVGMPDPEWGQRLVAVLVGDEKPDDIKEWVRQRLRSSKTPDTVVFRTELPKTETGKLLRRVLLTDLERAQS